MRVVSTLLIPILLATVSWASEIRREEHFADGKYVLGWWTDHEISTIYFDVTVQTKGFIGFGLSPKGAMTGADIVIGGVGEDGEPYFSDRHGEGNFLPVIDEEQNWVLDSARENATHTRLDFHRILDTCDKDGDIAIKEDTIKIIWSFGSTDTISYHGSNRGVLAAYMLDPPIPKIDLSPYQKINISNTFIMPTQDTTYWCSMHKGPVLPSKRHAVVFEHITETEAAKKHTHHFVVYRCYVPNGEDPNEYFGPYLDKQGECYIPNSVVPYDDCITFIFDWSVGGSIVIMPDNVGFPWGTERDEYFMLEVHADNPEVLSGVEIYTGGNFYLTDQLREHDAAMLVVSHKLEPSFVVPLNFPDFVTVGHCSPLCTSQLPHDVNVFNINLHSHISGRRMKLRHFREGTELPWPSFDDNYDFNYQEMRPLREHIVIKPGDQLTMECVYDSTWRDPPGSVIGGFSTREEMCESYLYYYPATELGFCLSFYPNENFFSKFGIEEVELEDGEHDPTIIKPDKWAGMTMLEVLDHHVNWTQALRDEVKNDLRFGDHFDSCGDYGFIYRPRKIKAQPSQKQLPIINYPEVDEEYAPIDQCVDQKRQ